MEDIKYSMKGTHPDFELTLTVFIARSKLLQFFQGMQLKMQKLKGVSLADIEKGEFVELPKQGNKFILSQMKKSLQKVESKLKEGKPQFKFIKYSIEKIETRKKNDNEYEYRFLIKGLYDA